MLANCVPALMIIKETCKEFFVELRGRHSFQADYFIAVDESLRKDLRKDFSFGRVSGDSIPKHFLRSWIDPSLAGADKEAMLSWVATTLESTQPLRTKLKVVEPKKNRLQRHRS